MSEYESPEWHPAFEEYCETIYELGEDDLDVIQARIAERMEVSRPAVSEMVKRLEAEGLIEAGREIKLTEKGLHLAETVVRRHRLAECFLTDILGLSWGVRCSRPTPPMAVLPLSTLVPLVPTPRTAPP